MRLTFAKPKVVINLVAGMIGLVFDQFNGVQPPFQAMAAEDSEPKADDLTKISGIGPAFARRLNDAGISSFSQLAGMSVTEIRERAELAEWQGDPYDWIIQAKRLADG